MRLKIVQTGDPVLRHDARPLTREEVIGEEIQRLIRDMRETMHDAPDVGLAAPQVGLPLQLAVIEDREELLRTLPAEELSEMERRPVPFHVIVNPEITLVEGEMVEFPEGCLSLTGYSALVPRARRVRVAYLDERGDRQSVEASGWYARILQHEIDHLHGALYIDHMYPRTLMTVANYKKHWREKSIEQIKKELLHTP